MFSLLEKKSPHARSFTYSMPIGNYYAFDIAPTCGIVSEKGSIDFGDTVYSFYSPLRTQAQLLWFACGWIEYRFPSALFRKNHIESICLSMELCSEAPGYKMEWPSDVSIELNGVESALITLSGDYGDRRGKLNPDWWSDRYTQYGDLYLIVVNAEGTFVNKKKVSSVTLNNLELRKQDFLSLRLNVKETAENVGGVNIFGSKFGDYEQDIELQILYSED